MAKFFGNLHLVLVAGLVLSFAVMFGLDGDGVTAQSITRWLHTFFGIVWIGLLYYFNFVQIPTMPKVPAELKPGISKHIAPSALFFFRWGAALTVLFGLIISVQAGYAHQAFTLQAPFRAIGLGMWIALIMAFNVWFIIWPNQKRALGIVAVEPDVKAKSARTAMLTSRINTILSVPMLFLMSAQSHNTTWFAVVS
jgi:uncharacterized membrane protein